MTSSQSMLDADKLLAWAEQHLHSNDHSEASHIYMRISQSSTDADILEQPIEENDIASLCEKTTQSTDTKPILHILVIKGIVNYNLPFANTTCAAFQTYWHLPRTLFSHMNWPLQMTYQLRGLETEWKVLRVYTQDIWRARLLVSFNATKLQTFAILMSDRGGFVQKSIFTIRATAPFVYRPEVLTFILTMHYVTHLDEFSRHLTRDFFAIERSLNADKYFQKQIVEEAPDITDTPRALTALTGALSVFERALAEEAKHVAFLEEILENLTHPDIEHVKEAMLRHTRLRSAMISRNMAKCQSMLNTTQAMVQMVYAMLQQRDNEINHRYAANVNVITAITLIFLPGTFIATLFSSSFWDFQPGSTGPVVSGWVWLYFVLTAALTLIVLGVWRGYTALKQVIKASKGIWSSRLARRMRRQGDEESGKKSS